MFRKKKVIDRSSGEASVGLMEAHLTGKLRASARGRGSWQRTQAGVDTRDRVTHGRAGSISLFPTSAPWSQIQGHAGADPGWGVGGAALTVGLCHT